MDERALIDRVQTAIAATRRMMRVGALLTAATVGTLVGSCLTRSMIMFVAFCAAITALTVSTVVLKTRIRELRRAKFELETARRVAGLPEARLVRG